MTTRLFGIHAVKAALDYSPHKIRHAWVDEHRLDARLKKILDELSAQGIRLESIDRKKMDKMADGKNHQGIIVAAELPTMLDEEKLKKDVLALTATPFYLALDQIQDPHNLGACLRTADAVGAQGVIVTKDNAVGITPVVCKIASGAAETVPVYQVTNLSRILRWMKEQNIWVLGATGETGQSLFETQLDMPLVIVIGAEGNGLRHLTRQNCDFLVKIPLVGHVESLNASVAAGILLYETFRQKIATLRK